MDPVLTELYEALTRLQYPGVSQINLEDLETTVLTEQGRVELLSWLLVKSSPALATHLEKFKDSQLQAEVLKIYSQMGICKQPNYLLGKTTMKNQIPILKTLLVFINNIQPSESETTEPEESTISEILDKHINESVCIFPATFKVSTKLNHSEATRFFDETRKKLAEAKSEPIPPIIPTSQPIANIESGSDNNSAQALSLAPAVEQFTAAFESIASWSKPKLPSLAVEPNHMDESIETSYKDFRAINQAFKSRKAISEFVVPKGLDKIDTPLSSVCEDIVIRNTELRTLNDTTPSE